MAQQRIFFAIDLPDNIKQAVSELILLLHHHYQHERIRWTKPNNLHVTLQFLASVNSDDLQNMLAQVRKELKDFTEFYLEFGELELFPTK